MDAGPNQIDITLLNRPWFSRRRWRNIKFFFVKRGPCAHYRLGHIEISFVGTAVGISGIRGIILAELIIYKEVTILILLLS